MIYFLNCFSVIILFLYNYPVRSGQTEQYRFIHDLPLSLAFENLSIFEPIASFGIVGIPTDWLILIVGCFNVSLLTFLITKLCHQVKSTHIFGGFVTCLVLNPLTFQVMFSIFFQFLSVLSTIFWAMSYRRRHACLAWGVIAISSHLSSLGIMALVMVYRIGRKYFPTRKLVVALLIVILSGTGFLLILRLLELSVVIRLFIPEGYFIGNYPTPNWVMHGLASLVMIAFVAMITESIDGIQRPNTTSFIEVVVATLVLAWSLSSVMANFHRFLVPLYWIVCCLMIIFGMHLIRTQPGRLAGIICVAGLSPLLLVMAGLNTLINGSPAIFMSERIGKNCVKFLMPKLRTLRNDSPLVNTLANVSISSNYIRMGKFFRKHSMDELFQFISIARGDMRLIGYRPSMADEYELNQLRHRKKIFEDRPGITGLAQVLYRDNEVSTRRKVACEKYYQLNQNWKLNLWILYRSAQVVFLPKK